MKSLDNSDRGLHLEASRSASYACPAAWRQAALPIAVLAATLAPRTAAAETWNDTFVPATLASHLGQGSRRLLVAAAGERGAELDACVIALKAALRAVPSVKIVIDDGALGDLAGLGDSAIVERAKPLPIDSIVVVRVFPAKEEGQQAAIVTFYNKRGRVRSALSGIRGRPATVKSEDAVSSVSQGVDSETVAAVSQTLRNTQEADDAALAEYKRKRVWFQGGALVNLSTGQTVSWVAPLAGEDGEPLAGATFYEHINRPDLAHSFRRRRAIKISLVIVGIAATLGGALGMLMPMISNLGDAADVDEGGASVDWVPLIAGGSTMAVGGVLTFVGLHLSSHPVDGVEARRLAAQFNRSLRERLGIKNSAARGDVRVALGAAPFFSRSGGGLSLALRF